MSTQQLIEQARWFADAIEDAVAAGSFVVGDPADCAAPVLRQLAAELEGVEQMNASLRSQNETLDAKLAELERLERKPLTREQITKIIFQHTNVVAPFIVGVARSVERAHHIGEGEGK